MPRRMSIKRATATEISRSGMATDQTTVSIEERARKRDH
jgi:hypothetical protein